MYCYYYQVSVPHYQQCCSLPKKKQYPDKPVLIESAHREHNRMTFYIFF